MSEKEEEIEVTQEQYDAMKRREAELINQLKINRIRLKEIQARTK